MRFANVVERLAVIPTALPDGPRELVPVLVSAGDRLFRAPPDAGTAIPAAVLVLLYPDDAGEALVLLTERVDRGGHHSGEVSFPGGRADPEDVDVVATALREAAEEVTLDPVACGLRVVGTLPAVTIPVSGFSVTPVVAVADRRPALEASRDEVATILEAPVASFLPGAPMLRVEREIRGWPLRYAAYPVDGLMVWGMTARVLGSVGSFLAAANEMQEQRDSLPPPV